MQVMANLSTCERTLSAMAVLEGSIYHAGGRSLFQPQRWVEKYVPETDEWLVQANMTVARRGLGLCILPGEDGAPDRLFAAGGQEDDPVKSVEVFDPAAQDWRRVAPMGEKRVNFGFAALGGHLYAIGGWDGYRVLESCEKYYPDRDEWVEIAQLPAPLCLHHAGVLEGRLYVVGGFQGLPGGPGSDVVVDLDSMEGWSTQILSFDPEEGAWRVEPVSLRTPRSDHGMVELDGRLVVLGGYNGVDRLNCAESFGAGDTETRVEEHLTLPMPARNFAAAVLRPQAWSQPPPDAST